MGNDGGSIAKRNDIINLYKKEAESNNNYEDDFTVYTICKLSKKSLIDKPIVSDYKGNMFLKEEIIRFLIRKGYKTDESFSHIKNLGDIIDIKAKFEEGKLICPVTKASNTFIYSRNCGCVVDKKLIDGLIKEEVLSCPNCDKDLEKVDIVVINNDKNNDLNYEELKSKGLNHSKKPKKSKKSKDSTSNQESTTIKDSERKRKVEEDHPVKKITK
ncbi:putative replication termination factor 2 [[Candida] jaroonii]|uniref:Replication termination factor 2 n=1 Tax=[Candida] jaroonii TaxID=467808 RepID=A0ACA9Y629_9ASCO|nr:putative replication termination factor 2 [[Candida] jaroonii]